MRKSMPFGEQQTCRPICRNDPPTLSLQAPNFFFITVPMLFLKDERTELLPWLCSYLILHFVKAPSEMLMTRSSK